MRGVLVRLDSAGQLFLSHWSVQSAVLEGVHLHGRLDEARRFQRLRTHRIGFSADSLRHRLLNVKGLLDQEALVWEHGVLLELQRDPIWQFVVLHDCSHFNLHLLEVVDKLFLASELHLADLLPKLLLKRSLALRRHRLQFSVNDNEGGLRVFALEHWLHARRLQVRTDFAALVRERCRLVLMSLLALHRSGLL